MDQICDGKDKEGTERCNVMGPSPAGKATDNVCKNTSRHETHSFPHARWRVAFSDWYEGGPSIRPVDWVGSVHAEERLRRSRRCLQPPFSFVSWCANPPLEFEAMVLALNVGVCPAAVAGGPISALAFWHLSRTGRWAISALVLSCSRLRSCSCSFPSRPWLMYVCLGR